MLANYEMLFLLNIRHFEIIMKICGTGTQKLENERHQHFARL